MEENTPKLGSVSKRGIELLKRVNGRSGPVSIPDAVVDAPTPMNPPSKIESAPTGLENVEYDSEIPISSTSTKTGESQVTVSTGEDKKEGISKDLISDLDADDDVDSVIEPNESVKKNFKNLRLKAKSVSKAYKEAATELETYRTKLKEYEEGTANPELIEHLNSRITQLEGYESQVNLKGTAAYVERITNPIVAEKAKIETVIEESGIDPEVINQIFKAENTIQQNKLFNQAGIDPVTALELKASFKIIKDKQREGIELEQEPSKSFAKLQEESLRIEQEKKQKNIDGIIFVSKEAWSESLGHLQEDNRFKYLQWIQGDTEHNERYAGPLRTKAGQDYGKMVRMLAEAGLTYLPKDLGVALARNNQLAHLSGAQAHEIQMLKDHIAELEQSVKTRTFINRPGVSGTGSSAGNRGEQPAAVGANAAGKRVLDRILNSR